jgi:hypothetical protein
MSKYLKIVVDTLRILVVR